MERLRLLNDFIERTVKLIQSSNKSSFRDALCHMLTQTVEGLKLGEVGNLSEFSKLVSETRNAVVHMSDNDKGQLNEAFARVNKLSLKLCFWYSVCQAHYTGVNIPNVGEFLFNNRNTRHGLPNEILER
jgi:fucose permease